MTNIRATRIVFVSGLILFLLGLIGIYKNPVFGLFAVGRTHNLIHIAAGVLAVAYVVQGVEAARQFAKFAGPLFGAIAVVGLLIPDEMILGVIASSSANNILHLVIGLAFLAVGYSDKDLTVSDT